MKRIIYAAVLALALCIAPAFSASTTQPVAASEWSAKFFAYDAPKELIVEQATPTPEQVEWRARPRQLEKDAAEPAKTKVAAKPRALGALDIIHIRFKDARGEVVPALLCTPRGMAGPFPLVVAVHGLTSNKAQVCAQVAPELIRRGFAVLAPDMPFHGERPGEPRMLMNRDDPQRTLKTYQQSILDVRQAIDAAFTLPQIDSKHGVVLAGYSMGSFIDSVAGPADERVKAMVLMVGGAPDLGGMAALIPQLIMVDPAIAIAHFAHPVLLLNARNDQIVTPDMGKRLFAAAVEPKKQIWYDSGHILPRSAYEDAAEWVATTWKEMMEQKQP
ncbi:MAG TPA: alpha/beta fold hydrolase [Tepidisphaeraceae bacterium]|jgi:dienelactone hydrolase